jgi:hypothetical protein
MMAGRCCGCVLQMLLLLLLQMWLRQGRVWCLLVLMVLHVSTRWHTR